MGKLAAFWGLSQKLAINVMVIFHRKIKIEIYQNRFWINTMKRILRLLRDIVIIIIQLFPHLKDIHLFTFFIQNIVH